MKSMGLKNLTQYQFDALVIHQYQAGSSTYGLMKAISQGVTGEALRQKFLNGTTNPGLINRRNMEYLLSITANDGWHLFCFDMGKTA